MSSNGSRLRKLTERGTTQEVQPSGETNADEVMPAGQDEPEVDTINREQPTTKGNPEAPIELAKYQCYSKIVHAGVISLENFRKEQQLDPVLQKIIAALGKQQPPPTRKDFKIIDGILVHESKEYKTRVCLPSSLIELMVTTGHYRNGHTSKNQIFQTINATYYCRNLKARIETVIQRCPYCIYSKADKQPLHAMQSNYDILTQPRALWSVDITHGFPKSQGGFNSILVFTENFSLYTILVPLKTKSTEEILKAFKDHIVIPFTAPSGLRSDGEAAIARSQVFQDYCSDNGISLLTTAPFAAFSNGLAERMVAKTKQAVRSMCMAQNDTEWPDKLYAIQQGLNNHTNTYGFSPQQVMFGHVNPTNFDLLRFTKPKMDDMNEYMTSLNTNTNIVLQKVESNRRQNRLRNEKFANKHRRNFEFKVNQIVNLRSHIITAASGLTAKHTGPYVINEISKVQSNC